MWYVYFIYSINSDITYVGMSQDPNKRLEHHNKRKSSFTSGHIPWVLFYTEKCENSLDARAKEKYYKGTGRPFVKQKLAEFLNS